LPAFDLIKVIFFSKKLENHIGAIWNFIHEYNRLIREKMADNDPNDIFSGLY
jgi:insertion element IS1 protein InsB